MTPQEFDATLFRKQDAVIYRGMEYFISGINFEQRSFLLWHKDSTSENDRIWVWCENVTYMPFKSENPVK